MIRALERSIKIVVYLSLFDSFEVLPISTLLLILFFLLLFATSNLEFFRLYLSIDLIWQFFEVNLIENP
jgi:hypothetical protein